MMDDLERLEGWLEPMIEKLGARERSKLTRTVAREMRRSNQQRIRRQVQPDGSRFEPRAKLRSSSGRIKRKAMFSKLRLAKWMRITGTPDSATVRLIGRAGRIASAHHFGLRDKITDDGLYHDYPERRLLGFSRDDESRILDMVLTHLSGDGRV